MLTNAGLRYPANEENEALQPPASGASTSRCALPPPQHYTPQQNIPPPPVAANSSISMQKEELEGFLNEWMQKEAFPTTMPLTQHRPYPLEIEAE